MARKKATGKKSSKPDDRRQDRTKHTAPTKNTSGGGFGFETAVVAASRLDLLVEQPLDGASQSRLDMVSAQTGPRHWSCDDMLLTYATSDDEQILIPTSIKSYPALSMTAKRDEFVSQAWTDALGDERRPRPIRLGRDRIGLFTAPHDPKLTHTLGELVKKAREQGSEFHNNVSTPGHLAEGTEWLSRLACPSDIAVGISQAEHQAFIASLELRGFDFELPTSQSYRQYENLCRLATP